jgi:hypothetical protein
VPIVKAEHPLRQRLARAAVAIVVAGAIWLPALHLFFRPAPRLAERLLTRQLALFRDRTAHASEAGRMRQTNPEWDFMGRTYLAWSLADLALTDSSRRAERLVEMDEVIDDTLDVESDRGLYWFLMPYAKSAAFRVSPPRSQFIDGEIALMLGLRRLVADKPAYRAPLAERVEAMVARMKRSPVLSAESYPNECWTFCNAVALAAIKTSDILEGTDHREFFAEWIAMAKEKLVEPKTGLLISSYTLDGKMKDGPEGSSIWMVAHALRAVDPAFAEDQYRRAKKELAADIFGFGFAREWPRGLRTAEDVDSGPIVPGVEASAGSSGLAFIAASSFRDADYLASLRATLDFAAFPITRQEATHYAASNQVGDAVVLHALSMGALWDAVRDGRRP